MSQLNLARMHERGRGVPVSQAEAMHWYGLAADAGNGLAREALSRLQAADPALAPPEPGPARSRLAGS